jgi:hypothetical protein
LKILIPHDELMLAGSKALLRVCKRGVCTKYPHAQTESCITKRCAEVHVIGNGGARRWKDTDALEGSAYTLYAVYSVHERKYVEMWAYFTGVFGDGERVTLMKDERSPVNHPIDEGDASTV